jgi:ubiquinone/menaquinone biosynthesis methyltransferase
MRLLATLARRTLSTSRPGPTGTASSAEATASFGFRDVPASEKQGSVNEVFRSVARDYDRMNDLMSGGLHRVWKAQFVDRLGPFAGMRHLDVAGGTGDIAFRVAASPALRGRARAPTSTAADDSHDSQQPQSPATQITVCDINDAMLDVGRERWAAIRDRTVAPGTVELDFVQGNAERIVTDGVAAEGSVDAYTIAFGIRNCTDLPAVLREAHAALAPGGRFMCLEFSHVENPVLARAYDAFSFQVIPAMGELVAHDRESYQYLVESIRRFPQPKELEGMMVEAGFSAVTSERWSGGIVAVHSGFKF